MRLLFPATFAAALAAASAASAQSYEDFSKGIYFDLRGGVNYLSDSDIDVTVVGATATGEAEFDTGFAIEGAAGYEHRSGIRGELAIGYRNNDFDDISLGGVSASSSGISVGGDIGTFSVMVNGYYGFDVGGGFKPFVGAGIGGAYVDAELEASVPGLVLSASDDDTVFAYQGIAGIEYEIPTDMATFALGVRYVYFATTDPEFGDSFASVEGEYETHSVMAGIRISR